MQHKPIPEKIFLNESSQEKLFKKLAKTLIDIFQTNIFTESIGKRKEIIQTTVEQSFQLSDTEDNGSKIQNRNKRKKT